MSYDVSALRVGPCELYFNGVNLGFTQDGVDIEIKTTTKRQDIDHFSFVEVQDVVMRREATIKSKMLETNNFGFGPILQFSGGVFEALPNGGRVHVPSASGLMMSSNYAELRIHPVDRDPTDTSEDIFFPRAAWSGNLSYQAGVDVVRAFGVEFVAYPDTSTTQKALFRLGG